MPAISSSERSAAAMTERVTTAHHGLLLTFRRPDELRHHLDVLAAQAEPLDTLLVVDNDADPAIRALVEAHEGSAAEVRYLGVHGNPGPAGGIAAGIDTILEHAADDDWLVLFDDDDPPQRDDTLPAVRATVARLVDEGHRVGGVALWGAALRRSGRLRVATGTSPEPVDYLPGGGSAHYSIRALRSVDRHDPDLFFGFDDLDLGLSLRGGGWSLWSSGLAREHGVGHMVEGRSASATVSAPTWRRYYSQRNHVLVLRRHGRLLGALTGSLLAGLAKPLINLPRRPRLALATLRVSLRALRDGWLGWSGKSVDPLDPPRWLR